MTDNSGALVTCTWSVFGSGWPVFSFLECLHTGSLKVFHVHKTLLLKALYKNQKDLSSLGPVQQGPNYFFTRCLNISSENKLILKFDFQLAGQKFSGLLPKSDQVLYVLRGKIQPLIVDTHNCLSSWMSMTPNLYNKLYRRPIQKWSLNP